MHCDRVYAILTRGPFPSGEVTDVAVEIHLAHCVECRRLAEALRPLKGRHEVSSAESAHLPGYRGDHPEWNPLGTLAMTLDQPLPPWRSVRRPPRPFPQLHLGRFVATVLLGVAIGVVLSTIQASGSSAPRAGIVTASFAGQGDNDRNEARVQAHLIYGLNLPRACSKLDRQWFYPLSADERSRATLASDPPSFVNQCCTQCHVAGGRTKVGRAQRSMLIRSCAICHGDSSGGRF